MAKVRETTDEDLDLEATAGSRFWTRRSMMRPGPSWNRSAWPHRPGQAAKP